MEKAEKNTTVDNFDRVNYKEAELEAVLGPYFNNTLNHKMKDKNTFKYANPTYGLWSNDILYSTANKLNKPSAYFDPYLNQDNNFRMNQYKRFDEEMLKAKNMMKKQSKNTEEGKEKPVKNKIET